MFTIKKSKISAFFFNLANVYLEPEKSSMNKDVTRLNRKPSISMPDLTPTALYVIHLEKKMSNSYIFYRADTTNQSSLFDLNASLNSSVYRKRRRKSLFRVNNNYSFFSQIYYSSDYFF